MTFELTREQEMLKKMVAELAAKYVAPRAEEMDRESTLPEEIVDQLVKTGLMGLNVPKQYGGSGLPDVCKVIAISELAKASSSVAEMYAVHLFVNYIINRYANEETKKKYLGMACSGHIGAFALTEPNAGSDAAGLQTTAVKDGDHYVLNGSKCFISNLDKNGEGSYAVVIAVTDRTKKSHGMTAFLVDRNTHGFVVGKREEKMGINGAAVSELILEDCRVPESMMLGQVGGGLMVALSGLDSGRVGIAAQSCGVAESALNAAIDYAKQRVQFGKPIADKQGLQFYLADMATRVDASYLLTFRAAEALDLNKPTTSKCASMAKYYASETANWVAAKALQIHGGYGYMKDYAIERIYRDARILTIYEGTSEIQKTVISRALLK